MFYIPMSVLGTGKPLVLAHAPPAGTWYRRADQVLAALVALALIAAFWWSAWWFVPASALYLAAVAVERLEAMDAAIERRPLVYSSRYFEANDGERAARASHMTLPFMIWKQRSASRRQWLRFHYGDWAVVLDDIGEWPGEGRGE